MDVGTRVAVMVVDGLPLSAVATACCLCLPCTVQVLASHGVSGMVMSMEAERMGVRVVEEERAR